MLHELFIALAGHSSALFDVDKERELSEYVSPSERGLLTNLARLGSLQSAIHSHCKEISSTHRSLVCRAAASCIISGPLGDFQTKVVDVESEILDQSPDYVGAYDIVPLSSIVRAFDGWSRRLEWLEGVVTFILHGQSDHIEQDRSNKVCTSARLIDFLRDEIHTGFPEIEETALQLLKMAESAWMRQLASWLLYGFLTSQGMNDFFIQSLHPTASNEDGEVVLHIELLPKFVDERTSQSVLFIGRSLRHIKRGARSLSVLSANELEQARSVLVYESRQLLRSIEHPIQSFILRKAVTEMRSILSRTALQKLLPLTEIVRVLAVLREFLLLERGEFAVALIEAADGCLNGRHGRSLSSKQPSRLGGMMMKEGEINSVLARTWSSLAALEDVDDDNEDETMELARRIISLNISRHTHQVSNTMAGLDQDFNLNNSLFTDVLLATPVSLTVKIVTPQDLFLSNEDVQLYSRVASYLLSIRRANMHLSQLWQLSVLRKCHPAPPRDSRYNSPTARTVSNKRNISMRAIWTIAARVNFFFSQLGSYLQGEVVPSCTDTLHRWMKPKANTRSQSSRLTQAMEDNTADRLARLRLNTGRREDETNTLSSDTDKALQPNTTSLRANSKEDPESITAAHRLYLKHLIKALFLDDVQFTTSLRNLMTRTDHIVALMTRLATVTATLQADERATRAPVSSSGHYAKEEADLLQSLDSVRKSMEAGLVDLVRRLNDMDEEHRTGVDTTARVGDGLDDSGTWPSGTATDTDFQPWKDGSITRLLMRLSSEGSAMGSA